MLRLLVGFPGAFAGQGLFGLRGGAVIGGFTLQLGGLGGLGGLRLCSTTLHFLAVLSGPVGVLGGLLRCFVLGFFVSDLDHGSRIGKIRQRWSYPIRAEPIPHLPPARCIVCTNL